MSAFIATPHHHFSLNNCILTQIREQKEVMGEERLDLSLCELDVEKLVIIIVIPPYGNIEEGQIRMDFILLKSLFNPKSHLSVK